MKALMILGAIVGFLIGTGFGMASQSPWPQSLWRASVAALVAALLTRWWTRVWMRGLRDALEHRRNTAARPVLNPKPAAK